MKKNNFKDIKNISVESPVVAQTNAGNTKLDDSKKYATGGGEGGYINVLHRTKISIPLWRRAIYMAEQNISSFYNICLINKELELEADVTSAKDLRINNVLSRPFSIFIKGEENEQLTNWLHNQKWVNKIIKETLESIFWGYSLLKIGDIENDNINDIESIKREFFNPKTDNLLKNYTDISGVDIKKDKKLSKWLLKVSPYSKQNDYLGVYTKVAPYSINQRMAYNAYADYLRRTGNGQLIIKSHLTNEGDRNNLVEYAKNIENSYFAIINPEDDVQFLEANGQGSATFEGFIAQQKSAITKLILGNDTINTEKSFVGSAQIAAAQSILYAKNDIIFVENVFNNQIFPALFDLGITFLKDAKLVIDKTNNLDLGSEYTVIKEMVLSGQYEIDDSYFEKKFGIPIKKIKNQDNI